MMYLLMFSKAPNNHKCDSYQQTNCCKAFFSLVRKLFNTTYLQSLKTMLMVMAALMQLFKFVFIRVLYVIVWRESSLFLRVLMEAVKARC
jgi:hypothetical protein